MISFEEAARLVILRLDTWAKGAISNLPDMILALIIILLFNLVARYLRRLVVRSLTRFSHNPALVNLTGTAVQFAITCVGLFYALGVLGLDKTVTSLLAGAGVVALAIGFALQDLTANFISGIIIAVQRPIQVGDVVETNGFMGRVIAIKLRSVKLDNFAGQTVEIPSKDVFQKSITNYTRTGERRMELSAGISYVDDLSKAQVVAAAAIGKLPFITPGRAIDVYFKAFAGDSIQFYVWFWIDPTKVSPGKAMSEAIKALKTAFDQNDILLVFAPYTLDLKERLQPKAPAQTNQISNNTAASH